MFINVGAYADNKRIITKTALKKMVKESPGILRFDQTSSLQDNGMPRIISLEMVTKAIESDGRTDIHLSVVGPDPYANRKWYATVNYFNGKYTVS